MIDYEAIKRAGGIGKGEPRHVHVQKRRAKFQSADRKAREKAWKDCGGICDRCDKRMIRGGTDILTRAEYNHTSLPREGGRKTHQGKWNHHGCHFSGPSGAHRRN